MLRKKCIGLFLPFGGFQSWHFSFILWTLKTYNFKWKQRKRKRKVNTKVQITNILVSRSNPIEIITIITVQDFSIVIMLVPYRWSPINMGYICRIGIPCMITYLWRTVLPKKLYTFIIKEPYVSSKMLCHFES